MADRRCGPCQLCCELLKYGFFVQGLPLISERGKPCPVQHPQAGCLIHGTPMQPVVCREFKCSYLRGEQDERPDTIGAFAWTNPHNGKRILTLRELTPAVEALAVKEAAKHGTVWLWDGRRMNGELFTGKWTRQQRRAMRRKYGSPCAA